MSQIFTYTPQDIGYLGLVAGMRHELKIAETIDRLLPPTEKQVSHGTAVCAMVLNGLGFVNQRLYLVPSFFANKPVERLSAKDVLTAYKGQMHAENGSGCLAGRPRIAIRSRRRKSRLAIGMRHIPEASVECSLPEERLGRLLSFCPIFCAFLRP